MKTTTVYTAKPVDFKFGEYINEGITLFRSRLGDFIIATILTFILSLIPFCSFMAMGNFFKFCRKIKNGEQASPGDIFDFKDFVPFFLLNLVVLALVLLIEVPILLYVFAGSAFLEGQGQLGDIGAGFPIGIVVLFVLLFVVMVYFLVKAFYMVGLMSLEGITDIQTAWKTSKVMTTNNILIIILFSIVVQFISQLGIVLCGIGLFFTLPLYYIMTYLANEDGIQQIKQNEIETIGNNE